MCHILLVVEQKMSIPETKSDAGPPQISRSGGCETADVEAENGSANLAREIANVMVDIAEAM